MTERERLIELIGESRVCEYTGLSKATNENIADYLLKNGVIILPVKVGQSIWSAEPFTDGVAREGWITTVMADHNGFSGFWVSFGEIPMSAEFMDIEIGQTVFLTKEEAEKALKGEN